MNTWLTEHSTLVFFLFLAGCFAFLMIRQHILNSAPEHTSIAVVHSRRMEPGRFHGRWSSGWNHLVTFRLSTGEKLELFTGEEEYKELKEGLRGQLVWQHDNFLSFDTDIT